MRLIQDMVDKKLASIYEAAELRKMQGKEASRLQQELQLTKEVERERQQMAQEEVERVEKAAAATIRAYATETAEIMSRNGVTPPESTKAWYSPQNTLPLPDSRILRYLNGSWSYREVGYWIVDRRTEEQGYWPGTWGNDLPPPPKQTTTVKREGVVLAPNGHLFETEANLSSRYVGASSLHDSVYHIDPTRLFLARDSTLLGIYDHEPFCLDISTIHEGNQPAIHKAKTDNKVGQYAERFSDLVVIGLNGARLG